MSNQTGVLVTAGAAGIGLAVVRAFLASGARVATCDVDEPALASLSRAHPEVHTSVCDVSDEEQTTAWVEQAAADLGGIRHAVSNAGIPGPVQGVEHLSSDDWTRVLDVNLTGAFLFTRQVIPHIRAAGGGSIVVMSSLAGRTGYAHRSPYAASKWGLIGYAKSLAREVGVDGIRVNAVLPGAVAGPRLDGVISSRSAAVGVTAEETVKEILQNQSIKEFVTPDDVAALVTYLCSDAAQRISGQAISIDGDSQGAM